MVDDNVRHPIIVDTDALIAVANTSLWPRITENLQLTRLTSVIMNSRAMFRKRPSTRQRGRESGGFMTGVGRHLSRLTTMRTSRL